MRLLLRTGILLLLTSTILIGTFFHYIFLREHNIHHQILFNTQLNIQNIFKIQPTHGDNFQPKFTHSTHNIGQPKIYKLTDSNITYFQTIDSVKCFINGTDWKATKKKCKCLRGWYGKHCSIPLIVMRSMTMNRLPVHRLKIRSKPRRVIHAVNVNHETDLLEVRVNELQEAVDVYLICESNYTAYGSPKPLFFLEKFQHGFLSDFQDKIVHVFQDHFPNKGRENGWIADGYQRTFLSRQGLKQVTNLRNDDLFLLLDADEIPKKEVITFLKLHDGYSTPVRLNLRWTIFGYFWRMPYQSTEVVSVTSIAMLYNGMANDAKLLRAGRLHPSLTDSFFLAGGKFDIWTIGDEDDEAGWHCSWCLEPEKIKWKLESAQNGDKPRWGDYDEKKSLDYIKELIRTGTWFDDVTQFVHEEVESVSKHIPGYVAKHAIKFRSLLVNMYREVSFVEKSLGEFRKWFGIA